MANRMSKRGAGPDEELCQGGVSALVGLRNSLCVAGGDDRGGRGGSPYLVGHQ